MNYTKTMRRVLKEVCDEKDYEVFTNGLSDNPNSVQIVIENKLWDENNRYENGCLYPIQLEVWGGSNKFVYRDYRYDMNDDRLCELSDYVTLDELKDVILNEGKGDSYKYGKIKEWKVV
jgi:hypothetical protein